MSHSWGWCNEIILSGNHRLDIGDISQGNLKGKDLEKALAEAFDDETPHVKEHNSPNTKKHGRN